VVRKQAKTPHGDVDRLRKQAERCYRLAREVLDLDVRRRLEELGREFERKAASAEQKGEPEG
jgi:hypothetical protein